ncbi:Succinate dehydrogenase/ fumarate reductase [Candidatus Ichthyocystis hellenicum]|uniref:Succinate dehydrogenase flavoprotein subunit n=1 Tax=Candidatus Ichthyocystis hellenicum TaxID=1561003 RepID=A0A0S4M2S9_9BURK|nr:succinate dehydrogenase flavoprotein subunit [Candidatus Ichthyocystis hellenicum]CUT18083.1 Succinate dehydrogenase/ fumarate reductase [Candidatus Ichthyocystis hellenicum]
MALPKRSYDVLVVGAGGSGLRSALELSRAGVSVAVISKVFPTRSHTVAAQGGIGASLANMGEDHWLWHMYDTVKGSDYLGDQDAIEFMCREAPEVVYELEHMGMPFDRNSDGTIYQRAFGGHTANFGEKPVQRSCCAADRTGHAMLHTLYQQNLALNTYFYIEWMAIDLIMAADGSCVGVLAMEIETGNFLNLNAKAVILATGGAGRIFRSTTNAYINTGDGLGMCARSGIPLEDMEFWQFHPTGVAGAGVLITEGVRGEGGILLNADGERFMERYAPTLKDLAPRDFVSRSMDQEIKEGRGCGPKKDHVYLKLNHLGDEVIMKRLPSIREIAIRFANVDPILDPIPVVPTIHYQMGGIPVDIHGRVVSCDDHGCDVPIHGLYAVGECSCVSVHGANRLGTNSLLDLVVFGRSTARHVIKFVSSEPEFFPDLPKNASEESLDRINCLKGRSSGENVYSVLSMIQDVMQDHCAVFRRGDILSSGVQKIMDLNSMVDNIAVHDKSAVFNTALVEALELQNMIEVAKSTMVSALLRQESRGAHARDDCPDRDDENWMKHSLYFSKGNRVSYKRVRSDPLTVDRFMPKPRVF